MDRTASGRAYGSIRQARWQRTGSAWQEPDLHFVGYGGRDQFSGGWGKNDWCTIPRKRRRWQLRDHVKLDRNTIADSFSDRDVRFVENIVGTDFDDRFRDDDSGIFHANFIGNAGDRFSFRAGTTGPRAVPAPTLSSFWDRFRP